MKSESMSDILLRYLGTSTRLEDGQTGLVWERGGDAIAVSEEDAKRLLATSRYDLWDVVSPEAKANDDAREQAEASALEAAAQAKLEELKAEAAAEPEPVVHPVEAAPAVKIIKATSADSPQDGDTTNSQEASK